MRNQPPNGGSSHNRPSTHTYRLFKFLKSATGTRQQRSEILSHPLQPVKHHFQTPARPTPPSPACRSLRNRRSAERGAHYKHLKQAVKHDFQCHTPGALLNVKKPRGGMDLAAHGQAGRRVVATGRAQMVSSRPHAGENSTIESPKAQPPEPLRQKDRVRSKTLESGTDAKALSVLTEGARAGDGEGGSRRCLPLYGRNLSGTKDRWGEPGMMPRSLFLFT